MLKKRSAERIAGEAIIGTNLYKKRLFHSARRPANKAAQQFGICGAQQTPECRGHTLGSPVGLDELLDGNRYRHSWSSTTKGVCSPADHQDRRGMSVNMGTHVVRSSQVSCGDGSKIIMGTLPGHVGSVAAPLAHTLVHTPCSRLPAGAERGVRAEVTTAYNTDPWGGPALGCSRPGIHDSTGRGAMHGDVADRGAPAGGRI